MEIKEFLKLLGRKKQTVLSILFLFFLMTTILLAFQPFKYEAKSRILLLQHNGEANDPYSAAKSNQFISSLLSQVVSSNAFLNDVFESGFNVDKLYFGNNQNDKLKKWEKTAEARAINDTGMIEINTYHTDKTQAEQINSAIINVIKTKNSSYYGRTEDISIKVINDPIVSKLPVRPNIVLNFILSIFISLLISFSYIIIFPEKEYDLSILPKRKKGLRPVEIERNNVSNNVNTNSRTANTITPNTNNYTERGDIKNIFDQSNTK